MGLGDQPRQRALGRLRPLCDGLQQPRVLLLLLWRLADGGCAGHHCLRRRLRHRGHFARRGRVGQALGVLVVARAACWGPGRCGPWSQGTCRARHAQVITAEEEANGGSTLCGPQGWDVMLASTMTTGNNTRHNLVKKVEETPGGKTSCLGLWCCFDGCRISAGHPTHQ